VSGIAVQCHCHNDFGLAIANTLAGLEAGATYFHVCINGIGERAGMPDLAMMTMALKKFHDIDIGIDTTSLVTLAALVSEASHQPLPIWQPIVGRNIFAHESGIHAKGMLKDTGTFEPFQPEEVGGERRYVIGKHSGRAVVKYALEERGVAVNDDLLPVCLDAVRKESVRIGGPVEPERLLAIYAALADPVAPALAV
jgi:homocitrate synthase NifV